ncbi:MAG: hypothetical protein Q4C01_03280 [Clostridia bacterium]|nr:hypothetical protein [Clostridia bacterium]
MEQKKSITHERTYMLKRIIDRNLYGQIEDLIIRHMSKFDTNNDPLMEKQAARINTIIDSCKTKEEIIEKLKAL